MKIPTIVKDHVRQLATVVAKETALFHVPEVLQPLVVQDVPATVLVVVVNHVKELLLLIVEIIVQALLPIHAEQDVPGIV